MNTTKEKAAFIDIDGTLLAGQSQLYFVKYLYGKKKISFTQYFLLIAWFLFYKVGFAKSPRKALSYALEIFKGKTAEEIDGLVNDFFVDVLEKKFYAETPSFINEIITSGKKPILVSAAIEPIVARVSKHLGVFMHISTLLEKDGNILTGRIQGEPVYGTEKLKVVLNFSSINNIDLQESDAFGDHLSDRALLEKVQRAVAVNPSPALLKLAKHNGWEVRYLK